MHTPLFHREKPQNLYWAKKKKRKKEKSNHKKKTFLTRCPSLRNHQQPLVESLEDALRAKRGGHTHKDTVTETTWVHRDLSPPDTIGPVRDLLHSAQNPPLSWFLLLGPVTLDSNAVPELAWPWVPALHKVIDFWISLCYKSRSPTISPMTHLSTRLSSLNPQKSNHLLV